MSLAPSICVNECRLICLHRLRTLCSWCLTEALNQHGETFDGIVALGTKIDILRVMESLSADQELSKLCNENELYNIRESVK